MTFSSVPSLSKVSVLLFAIFFWDGDEAEHIFSFLICVGKPFEGVDDLRPQILDNIQNQGCDGLLVISDETYGVCNVKKFPEILHSSQVRTVYGGQS